MTRIAYNLAAICALMLGVLHIMATVTGGFSALAIVVVTVAALWLMIGVGLGRQSRLAAYAGFLFALTGMILALNAGFDSQGAARWAWNAAFILSIIVAVLLFVVLWPSRKLRMAKT